MNQIILSDHLCIKYVIIKTKFERVKSCQDLFHCSAAEALYHATRHSWRINVKRANDYRYVLCVIDNVVCEVYSVKEWKKVNEKWANDDEKTIGRYEFIGEIAEKTVRDELIHKIIPDKFRKRGMQSPILYN